MLIETKINNAISDLVKIRDLRKNCIFCDKTLVIPVCMHYEKRRNSFSKVELYLANANSGCFNCNMEDEREDPIKQIIFRDNLIERWGLKTVLEIEKEATRVVKNSKSDKEEILKEIKRLTKELK